MIKTSLKEQPESSPSLAIQVIPPMQPEEDQIALEAAMQSLVLDSQHPVALELTGTAQRRNFIVRATSQTALDHVEALLRSQYPQVDVRPLRAHEDPFRLEPHEAVSAVELVAGAASYLPLRTWQAEKRPQETAEADPLLGLLASLSKLPANVRAISQIALVPAPANWSKDSLRKTVEDPLEPEKRARQENIAMDRQQNMAMSRVSKDGLSSPAILAVVMLAGIFALVRMLAPGWMWEALREMVLGQNPHLTPNQVILFIIYAVGLGLAVLLAYLLLEWIRRLLNPQPIYDMRMVAEKTSRMAYRVRLRLYVIGPKTRREWEAQLSSTKPTAKSNGQVKQRLSAYWQLFTTERERDEVRQETLLRLVAAYRQFHLASGAYFVPKQISPKAATLLLSRDREKYGHGWQQGVVRSKHLLSVDSLAALWHLPSSSVLPELALVEHRRARTMLIPPELARELADLPPIGYSEHGGYRLPFALSPQFFAAHTLIGGKSGEGKSTFMEHIAREAMKKGGLLLIDPHGDLCEHVLNVVPASRADDVVLVDLSDKNASVGINALDVTLGRGRDKAISDLLKTFAHIWVEAWGPRMENAFEMALRTLFEANKVLVAQDPQQGPMQQYTILDVLPVLTNENFCHALLQQLQDDYLHRWWREYYEPLTLMQQRDVINPVLTKVAKFESILARRIIGQSVSTLNFAQLIAERKIILVKLAKGLIGADVAALVGATLLGLLQITLEEQGSVDEKTRVRLPIILDEFQVLAGVDYGALAELRKYGATFFLATQSLEYLQKLDPLLLPIVLANVRQLIIFHMSAQDSDTLYKELGVELEDILNLDMHTCYVKLPAANRRQPSFSMKVVPLSAGDSIQAESIRTRSRVRYTCSVEAVDEMLREAMIRSIRLAPASQGKVNRYAVRGSRNAPPAPNGFSPVGASALPGGQASPAGTADADAPEVRKRRNRGRRGRGGKNKIEAGGGMTPAAFADEEDFEDELEMIEMQRLHKGNSKDGDQ
jgi:Helicase HerA, central domain